MNFSVFLDLIALQKRANRDTSSKETKVWLNWKDVSKMSYSWNVANEVLRVRLRPLSFGIFREAITEFTYS